MERGSLAPIPRSTILLTKTEGTEVGMKAAIWLRVSTTDQTIENQRRDLLRFAEMRGFDVVREYMTLLASPQRRARTSGS